MLRIALAAGLMIVGIVLALPAQQVQKPVGMDRRFVWTTSRVVGSPEPPPPYRARKVFDNLSLDHPIHVVRQPGTDRYLVITQKRSYGPTKLQRFSAGNPGDVETLLVHDGTAYDLVFHPDFANNGFFYLSLNGPEKGSAKKTQILRYVMDRNFPYQLDAAGPKTIIEWESDGHNGGAMAFDKDGRLFVTSGDGTSDSDKNLAGQNMSSLLSKVLRIDVDRPDEGKGYSVPQDNPFVGAKDVRPETWAYGLRNPWRMTIDPKTGHLWVGNNGQDLWEQAYLVKKGENYGWSVNEGSHAFYPTRKLGPTPIVAPTIEHHHVESRSLTGGVVYSGARFPELVGAYLYGDYSTGKIWAMKHDGQKPLWHKEIADSRLQITSFAIDDRGELLITDHRGDGKGALYTLDPTIPNNQHLAFPKTLSETGLFSSVKGHVVDPALIPYSVTAPFWGDHAKKERWIALPGIEQIKLAYPRGWNFPDGTVLVKSFALETRDGDPASKRWIETRLLTRQQGEWFGYSYAWNDDQTEAHLVEGKGRDQKFAIAGKEGERTQTWHYPSRTECMVCHSRAANWVLGLQTLQMNKDHDYGGRIANQIRTLAHVGAIKADWAEATKQVLRDEANAAGVKEAERDDVVAKQMPANPSVETFIDLVSADPGRRLVDPFDARADLTLRARSYLHVNCSQCHVEAGGGNAAFDVEFVTKADKMKLIDAVPQHDRFNLKDARLIAPGRPESSVLLHRIGCRGPGQMPPLATSIVDEAGVELLRSWIRDLKN